MARKSRTITQSKADPSRLPDTLSRAGAVLLYLFEVGWLSLVGQRVRVRRQGGYCGLDLYLALLVFYWVAPGHGMRKFWSETLGAVVVGVAALAGRKSLPSPAALSRGLSSVETALLRPEAQGLLLDMPGVLEVMQHPLMKTYDGHGQGWHVFDYDPTVTTLYQRDLPRDEDLPAPRRRAERLGKPGYSGRKRGDIQVRRCTVQHAGSSMWVHAHLSPGNGEAMVDHGLALDAIVSACQRAGLPLSEVIVREDGEYGNVPRITECRERKLGFLVRLNRPALFDDPDVVARMRSATWLSVEDSKSGPRRSAADLGTIRLHPDRDSVRLDGSSYEPIDVRVIATRFPRTGKAQRGRTLDGMQVELFAIEASAGDWPAADAAALYFARSAIENRLAQEDRELELDRIISYELPGQELATLVGLSVWNLRVAQGFSEERPPALPPVQRLRRDEVDDRAPANWPPDPRILRTLAGIDWPEVLANKPGWTYNRDAAALICEEGRRLDLSSVRPNESSPGNTGVIFRRPAHGCEDCNSRPDCFHSDRPGAAKHVELTLPTDVAAIVRDVLAESRSAPATALLAPPEPSGKLHALGSLFLPAKARKLGTALFTGLSLQVSVRLPPDKPRLCLVADDEADRQRRRKTWQQKLDRYALPPEAQVSIHVQGGESFLARLSRDGRANAEGGGS